MKYTVIKTKEAIKDISKINSDFIEDLDEDIELIETEGLDFVVSRPLGNQVFEIKSNRVRALFGFKENKLIVITVIYLKKTQKCPRDLILKAKKLLDNWKP
ncbi:MAG: type II toxin-antitoxin system RelE/ParE family toxin [Candidatus Gastranaerophilales bacterium]|nr:type II toxin-antitoxin system RelE/ParE family toxin [Candidatus Gastranaerophilales bacterium]